MNDTSKKQPVSKVSIYPVNAAIWLNTAQDGTVFYSVTLDRSYKGKDGKYTSTDSFNSGDLLTLAKVADMAHTEVLKLRANNKSAQTEEPPPGA